jgi:hypothetical protein
MMPLMVMMPPEGNKDARASLSARQCPREQR